MVLWCVLLSCTFEWCVCHLKVVLVTDADTQFEQFAANALCSPQAIVPCHLLEQGHGLLGDPWRERSCPRLVLPKELEALTMPPQKCLWLNNDEGLFPGPHHACQKHQEYAVSPGTGRPFHLSTQDDHLLTRASRFLPPIQTCFGQDRPGWRAARRK